MSACFFVCEETEATLNERRNMFRWPPPEKRGGTEETEKRAGLGDSPTENPWGTAAEEKAITLSVFCISRRSDKSVGGGMRRR